VLFKFARNRGFLQTTKQDCTGIVEISLLFYLSGEALQITNINFTRPNFYNFYQNKQFSTKY
jgi:hypothetical protein